ncbi:MULTISPECIES: amino acid ABC transporter ATP-binding protein [Pseudofrankia]|uniref:amino acid ABC transporter ATP-binding protein n=1 Tax=Pseudofrankia TaxID=2994363 RepID=UPI000234D66E|nr:amino acid ABC transporter ATP-binding protein [Pseudofrankia sp. EUN1h]OHV32465.1 peptide ABC transporter ATP-binding protein [Pseudofrankia sp. EUN1h]
MAEPTAGPTTKPPEKPSPGAAPDTPVLSVRGLRKAYGATVVLRDISFDLFPGQAVVLIGGSGSGKSTLLRCLNLLETVDDGDIHLTGEEITDPRANVDRVRRRIGVVFQAYNLFPHMTVLDNVTLAPVQVHRRPRAQARERARELLTRIGLADKLDVYPDRLSGGQQQRLAIVRALATDPTLLLLDEITSALDPELVGEVLGLVGELKRDGVPMVIATHEMAFAREIADEVLFLDAGAVAERGTPAQVLDDPTEPRTRQFLSRLWAR